MKNKILIALSMTFQLFATTAHADFAAKTDIQTGLDSTAAIGSLDVGDAVFSRSDDGKAPQVRYVFFSAGTEETGHSQMVYLSYGNEGHLITTMDQPFLTFEGKLVSAKNLIPGMNLMSASGESLEITQLIVGNYQGGIHHVATDAEMNAPVGSHLLVVSGVVVGDYILQMRQ